jgi:hypothetical protein
MRDWQIAKLDYRLTATGIGLRLKYVFSTLH